MLGISDKAVYRYIELGRLEAVRSVNSFLVPEEAVHRFKLNPPVRVRTKSPIWRTYNSRSKLLTTELRVYVRPGQQKNLVEKLELFRKEKRHTFPGTIERYFIKDDESFTTVKLWLIWKDTEMPDKAIRKNSLRPSILEETFGGLLSEKRAMRSGESHSRRALAVSHSIL